MRPGIARQLPHVLHDRPEKMNLPPNCPIGCGYRVIASHIGSGMIKMGRITYKSGRTTVSMSDDLERMIRRTLDKAAPTLIPVLEATTSTIEAKAEDVWPVRSGKSKAGLESETRITSDSVSGVLLDKEGYTYKIKFPNRVSHTAQEEAETWARHRRHLTDAPSADLQGKPAWNTLIRDPVRKAAKDVAQECGAEIKQLMALKGS